MDGSAGPRACPRCGHPLEPWIADRVHFGPPLPEGTEVPHDHLLKCARCGHEELEREGGRRG